MKFLLAASGRRLQYFARENPNVPEAVAAFVIKLFGAAISFSFSFLVAHHLGAAGTGSYALTLTTALFASTFALFGLDYVLLREMAGSVRQGKLATARGVSFAATRIVAVAAAVIGLLLGLFGNSVLNGIFHIGLAPQLVLIAAVAVVPLTLNRIAVTSLRGVGRILTAQWLEGPQAMSMAVAALGTLILLGVALDAIDVTILYFALAAISAIVAWWFYRGRIRDWPPAEPHAVVPMLQQGWRISFIILSRTLLDWAVLVSLGAGFSVVEVGQFRTAWQVTALIALIVSTFDTVAGPRIAAAHRVGETGEIYRILRQSVIVMMAISAPLFVLTLGFPAFVLGLFGPEFVAGATALRILALGQLVNVLSGPLGGVLLMTGQERWSARVSAASLVLLAILGVTLIPTYGLNGAALTTSLIILFRTGTSYILVRRVLPRATTHKTAGPPS